MPYADSIRAVNVAQANYDRICEEASTDNEIGAALDALRTAKSRHTVQFGSLVRMDGEWV